MQWFNVHWTWKIIYILLSLFDFRLPGGRGTVLLIFVSTTNNLYNVHSNINISEFWCIKMKGWGNAPKNISRSKRSTATAKFWKSESLTFSFNLPKWYRRTTAGRLLGCQLKAAGNVTQRKLVCTVNTWYYGHHCAGFWDSSLLHFFGPCTYQMKISRQWFKFT